MAINFFLYSVVVSLLLLVPWQYHYFAKLLIDPLYGNSPKIMST